MGVLTIRKELMKTVNMVFILILLQACASNQYQSLSNEELKNVTSASSVAVKYFELRPFNLMTPTGVVRAEFGKGLAERAVAKMTDSGEMAVKSQGELLANGIINKTTEKLLDSGVNIASIDSDPIPSSTPKDLKYSTSSDYVLEFSFSWGATYLPLNWKTYAISISGSGRLIRTFDQSVVWKGVCNLSGYDDERLEATSEDFKQEKPEILNSAMGIAAYECADQFSAQLDINRV